MLTNKNYFHLGAKGVYFVAEMDRDYNCRSQNLVSANPTGDTYSVAKVFTVTAVGICVDRGLLKTSDRFTEIMELDRADEKWRSITVDMLLKHRWGVTKGGLLDIDAENAGDYPTDDYLSIIMGQELTGVQGVDFCYTDAAFYMLSLIVEKVSGMTLFEFLRPSLMGVLRFGEYAWSSCPKGHTMGATGLFVRCRDVAKLGVLYLNGGVWNGERILSEQWCKTVLEEGYELTPVEQGWYVKVGMYGQMLAINPEKGLSVACLSHCRRFNVSEVLY